METLETLEFFVEEGGKPFVSLAASGSNSSTDCWQANGSIFSAILMGCKVLVNLQISVLRVMY